MPLYTSFIQEGTVSIVTKARIAEEITRIHTVMRGRKNFVRVVFLSYRSGLDLPMESRLRVKTLARLFKHKFAKTTFNEPA